MNTTNIKYKKSEISLWITSIIIVSFSISTLAYIYKWGNYPYTPTSLGLILALLFIVLILFYKLTIIIDDKTISAKFGIGLIKRSLELQDIDLKKIEKVKIPWYYGIGIRFTPYGLLYNTKPGSAILLKSIDGKKKFLVGTSDFDEIKNTLLKTIK